MRKETRIAIFAVITVAVAIWGYKYLNGFNLLSRTTTLYSLFERVDGLRLSNPVYINGLQVGLVAVIKQQKGDLNKIRVTMELDGDVQVPKTAVAELVTTSLMGGNALNLVFEGNCSGDECAKSGDYIQGITKGILASFASPEEMRGLMDELNSGLKSVLDTMTQRLSQSSELNTSVEDVKIILSNLKSTTNQLNSIMVNSASSIQNSLKNIESISANLKASNNQIKSILANVDVVSEDLKKANISGISAEAGETMKKLQTTLATSDKAIANLDAILANMKSGDGALSMLLNDPKFSQNLQQTVKNMDLLLQDVRLHPERYRRILSKKEMPYQAPIDNK